MRKAMMMVVLVMAMATGAQAAETKPVDITPADRAPVTAAKPATEEAKPAKTEAAAEKEEFAGTTMLRFFAKTVEAAREDGACTGLRGSESIQVAAY